MPVLSTLSAARGCLAVLALCAAAAPLSARAQTLLVHGSFEHGTRVDHGSGWARLASGSTALTGWTITGDPVAWSSPFNNERIVAADGQRALDMTGFGNENHQGGVAQTFATVAGASYQLSLMLGGVAAYGTPVQLRADVAGLQQVFSLLPGSGNTWAARSLDFTATAASTTLTLSGVYSVSGYYIGLDQVSVTAAVPEPRTTALLLAGLAMLGGLARRRDQKMSGSDTGAPKLVSR